MAAEGVSVRRSSRPCVTYDEVLQLVMVPLLLRRLSGVKP